MSLRPEEGVMWVPLANLGENRHIGTSPKGVSKNLFSIPKTVHPGSIEVAYPAIECGVNEARRFSRTDPTHQVCGPEAGKRQRFDS